MKKEDLAKGLLKREKILKEFLIREDDPLRELREHQKNKCLQEIQTCRTLASNWEENKIKIWAKILSIDVVIDHLFKQGE